jgi:acyl-coenzyme A synthetase/AMP-(fatty) acid ligase/acyl carrier protein
MWGALLFGGRLVVVSYWVTRSPDLFYTLLNEQAVTILNQTPSAFGSLIQVEAEQQRAADWALRLIIFGGEALDLHYLIPWWKQHGDQHPQLVNMYGITETTVHVTACLLSQRDLQKDQGSPLGRPLSDLSCRVLTGYQQLVPTGIAGELFVGGLGVARGYLHRPELTAERFVPDPWSGEPGARLYRTGDLVRWREDASMHYLGRLDHQVKIRGYRIELGEIEAVLRTHPGVQEGVVLVREDVPGEKHLVAYVVGLQEVTVAGLRSFLQEKLPAYMIPSQFLFLDAMPLTPNGKVDRKALPSPASVRSELEVAFISPRTPAEQVVAGIWAEILRMDHIGLNDNFFKLGGHSLRGAQVISRLRDAFQVKLPVRSLFERPTVEGLVSEIAQLRGGREIIEEIAEVIQKIEHLSEEEIKDILSN